MKGSFSVVVKTGSCAVSLLSLSFLILCVPRTAFATTVENTKAALKDNGFGVLTEIDFQKTFDAKLGEKILPSLQLGACNPKLAWQVYSDNEDYAVLLPCPVVVQAQADGTTKVSSIEPKTMFGAFMDIEKPALKDVACKADELLHKALNSIPTE